MSKRLDILKERKMYMKRKERNSIIKWACTLTDEELEKEYYDAVLDSLGSQTERMYDLGYDISDIRDREDYEKFLREKRYSKNMHRTIITIDQIEKDNGNC